MANFPGSALVGKSESLKFKTNFNLSLSDFKKRKVNEDHPFIITVSRVMEIKVVFVIYFLLEHIFQIKVYRKNDWIQVDPL